MLEMQVPGSLPVCYHRHTAARSCWVGLRVHALQAMSEACPCLTAGFVAEQRRQWHNGGRWRHSSTVDGTHLAFGACVTWQSLSTVRLYLQACQIGQPGECRQDCLEGQRLRECTATSRPEPRRWGMRARMPWLACRHRCEEGSRARLLQHGWQLMWQPSSHTGPATLPADAMHYCLHLRHSMWC